MKWINDNRSIAACKIVLSILVLFFCTNTVNASTYNWTGATSSYWDVGSNWTVGVVTQSAPPGPLDNVQIGVANTFTNQPIVRDARTCANLYFGILGTIVFTVNTVTPSPLTGLTVTGNITQYPSSTVLLPAFSGTTLAGTGFLTCTNFQVGDNTTSDVLLNNTLTVTSQIASLTVANNLNIYSTDISVLFVGVGYNNSYFSLQSGIMAIGGQIYTLDTKLGLLPLVTNATAKFSVDVTGTYNPILTLSNTVAINPGSIAGSIDFFNNIGGTGKSTVYYNGGAQNVYTNTTAALDNTPQTYQNLLLNGTGAATVNSGTLLVGNNFFSSAPFVLFNTNNPVVSVGGSWTNSSNAMQGTGNITIGGALTNNSGGVLNLSAANLYVGGNYANNVGGVYNQTTGTTYFTAAVGQTLVDNSTTGTLFKNVTFNGGGLATMSAGTNNVNFAVASTYTLTMTNNSVLIAGTTAAAGGASYLTLRSDVTGSATVAPITGTAAINGNVNVQRFLTGGNTYTGGRWVYRAYRLMSSPVNAGLVSGAYPYTLNYLAANAIVTDAKSTYGTIGGNPTIYLYSEDYAFSNAGFTSGNFQGVTDISNVTSPFTLAITNNGSSKSIYVGNGFLFFFRGDNIHNVGTSPGKTIYPYVAPESTVFTATGFLNQGSYTVKHWSGFNGLLYTTVTTPAPGNSTVMGFNLVGNPYASSIDWSTYSSSSATAPIYAPNVNPTIWQFDPVTQIYGTYNATTGVALNNGNKIIVSGQGFFVQANNTGATLKFNETAKSTAQISGTPLLMGIPLANTGYGQDLRMTLSTDSVNKCDMLIGFNSNSTKNFNPKEDDLYYSGSGPLQAMWTTSADKINVVAKWMPLPKATTADTIKVTINTAASGQYTLTRTELKAVPALYDIWLMDRYKKDSLDIKNNTAYVFNVDKNDTASYGSNRFQIIIRQNPALELHLLNFTATKATGGAQTTWKTENEQNYTNFTVERSTDNGVNYAVLGSIASSGLGNYSFLDKNPGTASNIYRLKIVDLNGAITYSNAIMLNYSNSNNIAGNIMVYPNPAKGVINLSISQTNLTNNLPALQNAAQTPSLAVSNNASNAYTIKIINISGSVIQTASSSQAEWQGNVSALVPGTYFIQVVDDNDKTLVGKAKFIKQ